MAPNRVQKKPSSANGPNRVPKKPSSGNEVLPSNRNQQGRSVVMNNASARRVPEPSSGRPCENSRIPLTRAATVPFFAKEMEAQKGYSRELLVICDKANGDDDADRTTKCPVHTSTTSDHAKIWRSDSTSLYHLSNWALEEKDEVIPLSNPSVKKGLFKPILKLQASHHQNDLKPPYFVTLGHRICRREVCWDGFNSRGDFVASPGYWEWVELILWRNNRTLKQAGVYDSVMASLFVYDRDISMGEALCEAWCPATNTFLSSRGEASISLWDLKMLGGLPIIGEFYYEVVPSFEEITGTSEQSRHISSSTSIIPSSCQTLFRAYHLIRCRLAPDSLRYHRISISDWVSFWFRGRCRYNDPFDFITVRGKPTALRCPNGLVNNHPRTKDEDELLFHGILCLLGRPRILALTKEQTLYPRGPKCASIQATRKIEVYNARLIDKPESRLKDDDFEYFVSVRSCYLNLSRGNFYLVEPYSPHPFTRQFGYCQDVPGSLISDIRTTTLRELLRYWHCSVSRHPFCEMVIPKFSNQKFHQLHADNEAEGIDDVNIVHQVSEDSDRCHPRMLKRDAEISTEAASILGVSHSSNPDSTQVKRKRLVTSNDGIKNVAHINSELFGASDSEDDDKIPLDALVRKNTKKGDVTRSRSEESVVDAGVVLNQVKKLSAKIGSVSSSGHDTELNSANLSNKQVHANDVLLTSKVVKPHFAATNLPSTEEPVSSVYYPGKYSSRIFENAIKGIGRDFLLKLRDAPFFEVNRVHKDASAVYSGIESLQGDPAPLKVIVDSYVGEVNALLHLESVLRNRIFQQAVLVQGQQKKVTSELQSQIDVVDKAKGEIVSSEKLMSELEATSAIADEDMASIEGLRGTVQTHRDSLVDRWNGGS
ncbi:hypothetical protein COLO4_28174 [Corchorus olitorius]|uniref:Aminotransferase-like plant mobile domain-containing protein n=1 Tax=Corchorus olitorius TaxID=93759 RepID=A0A1R3HMK5_9ROSI|nr:hypothetical protein COLO4_28174 [Corchorus olitorius]